MQFRQIQQFAAVARAASFLAASRDLHMSQPALSYQVKQLEAELGVQLLQRHSRGVALTPAGALFLRYVDDVIATLDAADRALDLFREERVETLLLGASPTPARALVPGLMAAIEANSKLRLSLTHALSDELYDQVLAGQIQGAFCYDPAVTGRVRLVPLYSEDLFLVGSPSQLQGDQGEIPFENLGRYKLALDRRFETSRRQIDAAAAGRVKLNIATEVAQIELSRNLLVNKGYCTIVPYGLFAEDIAAGQLQARLICDPVISRTLCMIFRPEVSEEAIQFLMSVVSGIVRQKIKEGALGWRLPQVRSLFP